MKGVFENTGLFRKVLFCQTGWEVRLDNDGKTPLREQSPHLAKLLKENQDVKLRDENPHQLGDIPLTRAKQTCVQFLIASYVGLDRPLLSLVPQFPDLHNGYE